MVGSATAGRDRLPARGKPSTPRPVGRQAPAAERQSTSTSGGQGEGARAARSSGNRDDRLARNPSAMASEADRSKIRWQQETESRSPPNSPSSRDPGGAPGNGKPGLGLSADPWGAVQLGAHPRSRHRREHPEAARDRTGAG